MKTKIEWQSVEIEKETGWNKWGLYRIQLVKDDMPVKISRFGGIDEEGVLVIGRSNNIENRRKQFRRSARGHHGHSEGVQWWLINHKSDNRFDEFSLRFAFVKISSEEEAKEMEEKELKEYFKKFSELPPLNGVMPKRIKWFDELRKAFF
jgi:hypothetical protein